jgi:hypothetical protein
MKNIFILLLGLFFSLQIFSQDRVWLTDGTLYNAKSVNTLDSGYVTILTKRGHTRSVDTADIFAIITRSDTLFLYNNKTYPLQKAKIFMEGQKDGKKYKNTYVYSAAFATGLLSPFLLNLIKVNNFLSPLVSGIFALTFASVNPDKNHKFMNSKYLNNDDYKKGFRISASKQKIKNIAIYSSAGLFCGIVVLYFIK